MNLIPFDFNGLAIRVVEEGKEPFFVAKDVCDILGYTDAEAMTRRLDDDEVIKLKDILKTDKPSGSRKNIPNGVRYDTTLISESGLYTAIFGSTKKEAKPFKRWVTHEVLPSIRKTGGYGVGQQSIDLTPLMEMLQKMMIWQQQQNEMILQLIKQQSEQINKIAHTQETYILIRQENRASTITAKQTDELVELIEKAAVPFAKYHRLPLQSAQRFLFGKLNERMAVKKYYHIKAVDFNKAMKYINELKNAAEASTNSSYKKILETNFEELGWGEEVPEVEDEE